jgi:hypothetical protein
MSNFGSIPNLLSGNTAICTEWTFDASAQTLWSDLGQIVFAINVTDGLVIYNPTNPGTTATTIESGYLKLVYDTTSMNDNDDLLVFCELDKVGDDTIEILQNILEETQVQTAIMLEAFSINIDEL